MEERKTRHDGSIHLNAGFAMNEAREQLIMVLDMRASNRVKSRVSDRVIAGKCLGQLEDGSQCECAARTRGLCNKCHYRWRMLRLRMSGSDAAVYDSKLIRTGRLLSAGGAKHYRSKSIYARLANEAS